MLQITNATLGPAPDSKWQIKQHTSPNRSGALIKPELIIVHDTASGLESAGAVSWLCSPEAKASAHFVVGRTGLIGNDVHQLVPTNLKAWHAGKSSYKGRRSVNNFSLGIEIVNPGWMTSKDGKIATFSRGSPSWNIKKFGIVQMADDAHPGNYWWMSYTVEQIDAVIEICRALVAAYPSIKNIEAHYTISPGRKVDVNPLFPMARVRSAVFNNRGPVSRVTLETEESRNIAPLPPASNEKDEEFEFDALTTSDLNLRPAPDAPKRLGVIKMRSQVDIVRQTVSRSNGAVWYFVRIKAPDMARLEDGVTPDSDGMMRGFVHGSYLSLVS